MSAEVKALLGEAAASGVTTSTFVLAAATPRAREVVGQHQTMVLSAQDSATFVDQLLHPAPPTQALRQAAARYGARVEPLSE